MTREDAIKIIKNEEDCVLTDCYRPSCESCNLVMETNDILTALDMAIEALEQEPCDDAVSREAAIDAALSAFSRGLLASPDIRKLPSAQPAPKWIPCSERLPEYMESVLTWDGVTYCVEKRIRCIRDEEGDPIEGDWWVSDGYDDIESDYYPDLRDGAAIAWMPLPEPYRAERRTDELRSENSR